MHVTGFPKHNSWMHGYIRKVDALALLSSVLSLYLCCCKIARFVSVCLSDSAGDLQWAEGRRGSVRLAVWRECSQRCCGHRPLIVSITHSAELCSPDNLLENCIRKGFFPRPHVQYRYKLTVTLHVETNHTNINIPVISLLASLHPSVSLTACSDVCMYLCIYVEFSCALKSRAGRGLELFTPLERTAQLCLRRLKNCWERTRHSLLGGWVWVGWKEWICLW